MKFLSTRNPNVQITASEAIIKGLAPDGGLYIPEEFKKIRWDDLATDDSVTFAHKLLESYFEDDFLKESLLAHCKKAFSFPLPVNELSNGQKVLELFHGPTCAFKDVGARFLSSAISKLPNANNKPRLVLVATSGDTGGAVAAAFNDYPDIRVAILYPKGKVSKRQEQQLTCWNKHILAFSVEGTFDDCQRLVKEAFLNDHWNSHWELISANSISVARLLPQMVYYALTSLNYYKKNEIFAEFIIPTGNLGNAVAAFWAKKMGMPIDKIGLALNANDSIINYTRSGVWKPQPSKVTLANAMDVGSPSNIERLFNLYPDRIDLNKISEAVSATDEDIKNTIQKVYKELNYIICPHTATAFYAQSKLKWDDPILVSTAHPAKFEKIVEPLIKKPVTIPPALQNILSLPSRKIEIEASLDRLNENLI